MMRKVLKKAIGLIAMTSLAVGVLNVASIHTALALEESDSVSATVETSVTPETSETSSEETSGESADGEMAPDETMEYDITAFDPVFTEENVQAPLMVQAFEDYKTFESDLQFKDLSDVETPGSSVDDVIALVQTDITPMSQELTENQTMLVYTYESEEVIPELEDAPMHVDMGFFFLEDELFAMVIMPYAYYAEEGNLIPEEELYTYLENGVTPAEIDYRPQSVYSFSQIMYEDQMYSAVLTLTGSLDTPSIDNMIFEGAHLIGSTYFMDEDMSLHPIDLNTGDLMLTVAPEFYEIISGGTSEEAPVESGTESSAPAEGETSVEGSETSEESASSQESSESESSEEPSSESSSEEESSVSETSESVEE